MNEKKIVQLIKKHVSLSSEEEIKEFEDDEYYDVFGDVSIEGLAMNFSGIEDEHLENYFDLNFGYGGQNMLLKTDNMYYHISVL